MSSAIDYVRYSCGIAGEDVANYVDELEKRTSADTDLIEQLTARVRELEEEKKELQALFDFDNARLDQIEDELEDVEYLGPFVEGIKVLKTQLATSQLRETQLRDDLEAIAAGSIKIPAREYAMHALALPTDTSALDAYVAEKVKELNDEHRRATLIRYEQTAEIIRQRDLAVEALRYGRLYAPDGSIALDNINAALSAIKESEGK